MATIKDIAEKLGVSVSTVSKGLNGGKDISESLRRSVLDTAVELGYTNRRARKEENRKLCLFVENMDYSDEDQFGYEIVLGFRQAAYKDRWEVDVLPAGHEFQAGNRYDAFMLEKGYSGSFILGFSFDDPWMEQFASTDVPTVLLDNFIPANPQVGQVGTDSEEAIDMAIEHLIKLGHEKIAFLGGSRGSRISDQRMLAYLNSMAWHHISIDPNMAVYGYYVSDAAKYHVPGFLDLGATAILCGNDAIAAGVIDSVKEAGLRVPEDVSVVGFDDLPFAAHLTPPLTTIRQDRLELGKSGFFILHALIEQVPLSRSMMRPALIRRSSTAPAKPRIVTKRSAEKDSVLNVNPVLYEQHRRQVQELR